ncbi:MAG: CPBP family intramembrane metalloprotease [Pseudomonadales bacterium]|nr:CPBP family intramembrane metalloprotease [Pseudomonadales bacterium]
MSNIIVTMTYLMLGAGILASVITLDRSKTHIKPIAICGIICILMFYWVERLALLSAILLLLMTVVSYFHYYFKKLYIRIISILFVACVAFIASSHLLDVSNLLLYKNITVSDGSPSFSIYANFDKGIAGLALILLLINESRGRTPKRVKSRFRWGYCPILVIVILAVGALSGLGFDPKIPNSAALFLTTNMFFSTVTEEAFFRGLIQGSIIRIADKYEQWVHYLVIIGVACLFGVAHIGGGVALALLATFAGIGYGLAYYLTGRLSAAILVHFGVNAGHYLLLEYPV